MSEDRNKAYVHLVKRVVKPRVKFACDEEWEAPEPEHIHNTMFIDIYKTTDGRFYTFDPKLVTCPKCRG